MTKKPTRRDKAKYPALDPKLNLKARYDLIDYDYVDNLPETWVDPKTGKKYNPKQFLNDFTNEYTNASFNSEKRIHRKKKVPSPQNALLVELKGNIFVTIKEINELISNSSIKVKNKNSLRKLLTKFKKGIKTLIKNAMSDIEDYYKTEAEARNNARNKCILTKAKSQGKATDIDSISEYSAGSMNVEDALIDAIDGLESTDEFEDETTDSADGSQESDEF